MQHPISVDEWVHEATLLRQRCEAAEAELVASFNALGAITAAAADGNDHFYDGNVCTSANTIYGGSSSSADDAATRPIVNGYMYSLSAHHTRATQLSAQLVAAKRCPQRWLAAVKEEVEAHIGHDEDQVLLLGDTYREAALLIAMTESAMAEEELTRVRAYEQKQQQKRSSSSTSVVARAGAGGGVGARGSSVGRGGPRSSSLLGPSKGRSLAGSSPSNSSPLSSHSPANGLTPSPSPATMGGTSQQRRSASSSSSAAVGRAGASHSPSTPLGGARLASHRGSPSPSTGGNSSTDNNGAAVSVRRSLSAAMTDSGDSPRTAGTSAAVSHRRMIAPKPAVPTQQHSRRRSSTAVVNATKTTPLSTLGTAAANGNTSNEAVAAFEAFMAQFPLAQRSTLGWSEEDHAVFTRCILRGNHSGQRLYAAGATAAPAGGAPHSTATAAPGELVVGGGAPMHHIGNAYEPVRLNGAVPLPSGAYLNADNRCATNYCRGGQEGDGGDDDGSMASAAAEGVSAVERCLALLPHMALPDISLHMRHYETYVVLLQRKHDAIEAFKAQRAADAEHERTVQQFKHQQEAAHEQLAVAAKERARLIRQAHNKRLVDGWRANKAAAIRHTAVGVLSGEQAEAREGQVRPIIGRGQGGLRGTSGGDTYESGIHFAPPPPLPLAAPSPCPSATPAATLDYDDGASTHHYDPHHLHRASVYAGGGAASTDHSAGGSAPAAAGSHNSLDAVTMRGLQQRFAHVTNEAELQQLLWEVKEAEERKAASERIAKRQAEIKGDVAAYKEAKRLAAEAKLREEEALLRAKGYPIPPRGYRASSSFASSSSAAAPTGAGRASSSSAGHYDPYNLHATVAGAEEDGGGGEGTQGFNHVWENIPQRRAHSSGGGSARPASSVGNPPPNPLETAGPLMLRQWAKDEAMVRRRQELAALKEAKLHARDRVAALPVRNAPKVARDANRLTQPTASTRTRSEVTQRLHEERASDGSRLRGFSAAGAHAHLGSVGWAGGLSR